MSNSNQKLLLVDIETWPDVETAKLADKANPNRNPFVKEFPTIQEYTKEQKAIEVQKVYDKKYKKPETTNKYVDEIGAKTTLDYQAGYNRLKQSNDESISKLATKPMFAMVKMIKFMTEDMKFPSAIYNKDRTMEGEKDCLEKIYRVLFNEMAGKPKLTLKEEIKTRILVTFNGKGFDIPVIIERGQIHDCQFNYMWLEQLMNRGMRANHYDIFEPRNNHANGVGLSLSANLAIRYGKEFAKHEVDHATASFEEIDAYSTDEMMKMMYWVKRQFGDFSQSKEEFLASLPDIPDFSKPEIPGEDYDKNIQEKEEPKLDDDFEVPEFEI